MRAGKAAGLSDATSELMKVCRNDSVKKQLLQGKGDVRSCGCYSTVQLLEYGMKVIERIIQKRLRDVVRVDKMQGACREEEPSIPSSH